MITREFNLYLHAGHSIPLVINANQYDRGEQWLFTLFNADGTQYVPSSGAIVGIKSDNLGIINSGTVDASGRVVINETQQMTAAVGKAVFELVIDDGTHGTANFVVLVEPKPGDNADLSESDISMIEQAIEAASTIKPYGSPLVASTVAGMTDHEKVYVYVGSETGYTSGHWYYYDGDSWEDGGVYNSVAVQTDTTLAISGMAADAKKTGDEISDLKSQIDQLEAIPRSVKLAMDTLFQNLAFKNDNESYTDELTTFHAWATAVNLTSITAVYEQSGTVYSIDSLDSLKSDLVVTAHYDDGTDSEVSGYTLSGTLADGTSVITVTLEDKTTSFNVTVTGVTTLYTVENHTFDGTSANTIDTEIKLHDEDKDFTILIDFTAQAQGSGSYRMLSDVTTVTGGSSGLSLVKYDDSKTNFRWCNATTQFSDWNKNTTGNIKFVIQHEAESGVCTLKLKKGSNEIKTYTDTSTFLANDANLLLGTNKSGTDTLKGTGSFYIYGDILDSDHITAFLNGE